MEPDVNYTEINEDHSAEGYTARIRRNKIFPQLTGPLTIIEFSLTKLKHDELKAAFEKYVERSDAEPDLQELCRIVRDVLPESIIEEFIQLKDKIKGSKNVYVIHNLPEIADEKTLKKLAPKNGDNQLHKVSSISLFQYGLATLLGMTNKEEEFILTRENNRDANKCWPHNHSTELDMLGIAKKSAHAIIPTAFIDFRAVLDEAASNPELAELKMFNYPKESVKLSDFDLAHPKWSAGEEVDISLQPHYGGRYELKEKHEAMLDALLDRHSQKPLGEEGTLFVFTNRGEILHSGQHASFKEGSHNQEYTRVAIGTAWDR